QAAREVSAALTAIGALGNATIDAAQRDLAACAKAESAIRDFKEKVLAATAAVKKNPVTARGPVVNLGGQIVSRLETTSASVGALKTVAAVEAAGGSAQPDTAIGQALVKPTHTTSIDLSNLALATPNESKELRDAAA